MSGDLENKAIIVTGAGTGIGRAAAIACAAAGACVIAADIDEDAGNRTVTAIQAGQDTAIFVRTNVAFEEDVEFLVDKAVRVFGTLHGAFNNAGISQNNVALHELTLDQWRRIQSVNYDGVFLCMKHEIRAMLNSNGGSIVNTSSALGRLAVPHAADYCGSKSGVLGLTRGAAIDYGRQNIRVNAILPGIIRTKMTQELTSKPHLSSLLDSFEMRHPIGRLGLPNEVADAVVWLLSEKSSFVTGIDLPVDGGYLAG